MVSKKKQKFLKRFLRTISLESLLPIYVRAISNNDRLFQFLPDPLVNPTIESLKNFQSELSFDVVKDKELTEDEFLRGIKDLTPEELLVCYVESVKGNSDALNEIPESTRGLALYWLNEIRVSVTGEDGFFSNETSDTADKYWEAKYWFELNKNIKEKSSS